MLSSQVKGLWSMTSLRAPVLAQNTLCREISYRAAKHPPIGELLPELDDLQKGDGMRVLKVQTREFTGRRLSNRLRFDKLIPGVIVGKGKDPQAICVELKQLEKYHNMPGGYIGNIYRVEMENGETQLCVADRIQLLVTKPLNINLRRVDNYKEFVKMRERYTRHPNIYPKIIEAIKVRQLAG
ncbi:ribosomal 5S rRNA E-loop binding protein Ctc/L25/TL5 [Planoprotostelium fungivorum]|uniref:Ribosomal 5S rRNA E-loop binding protein Ctc/L25/TL5 n=1 Tax=Planoprotostelium fungivorum TaxID=1890364 RepID=A0A2P6NW12_9EUKA|nr:ribosomal 5S rRNA E-loop binding protein Ctc/L25/TL5 [Planoprotostelium fungivorum]